MPSEFLSTANLIDEVGEFTLLPKLDWLAGFLVPEMANPYDKTAVAIYAMRPTAEGIDSEIPFKIVHGGYMDKESAKKVHKKLGEKWWLRYSKNL